MVECTLRIAKSGIVTVILAGFLASAQAPPPKPEERGQNEPPAAPMVRPGEDPRATIAAVDPTSFQIGAEDILFVQVWREPDFTRQVMVRPDGKITMPLIGEVVAAGLTPDQLTGNIAKGLAEYLNKPEVLVSVLQVNSKKYYMNGEVNRPGVFPLVVPTRVLEALSAAGGFREFANTKNITILRKGERLKFNYKDVIKGKKLEQNIYLEPGDHIIVP
jgi:polysaccharide biosynthesis/export protein